MLVPQTRTEIFNKSLEIQQSMHPISRMCAGLIHAG